MNLKLSNRQTVAVLVGSFCLALGIGSGLKLWLTDDQTAVVDIQEKSPDSLAVAETSPQSFDQPFVGVSSGLDLANPALLKSTPKDERVITVAAGRSNPFAPITRPAPVASRSKPQSNSQSNQQPTATSPAAPPAATTVPVAVNRTLPTLPPMAATPAPVGSAPLPTVAVAPNSDINFTPNAQGSQSLNPLPASPVDRVEISGVAQLDGRVRVIIRELGADTSRHVAVGDRIAGGQVRVKRVDLSGIEPMVVLEYDGREFYRSVGSTSLAGMF